MPINDAYWRPMRYFNLYRFIVACLLAVMYFIARDADWWQLYANPTYFRIALGYVIFAIGMATLTEVRRPRFEHQVTLQAIIDISFIVLLMHSAGGVKSGLGLLLVIAIVGAALVSQGRLALFYAAVASIALLLEQSAQILAGNDHYDDYSQSVMLSLSCFATAWLAYTLAKRMRQSEALASQRGIDLENLNQVNELIIQDMQDGVLVVDGEFLLRHHNARAEMLLGITLSSPVTALEKCVPEVADQLRMWIRQGQENRSGVAKLVIHGKELRLRFHPIGVDRIQGAVVFIEDWSRVQAQARQLKLVALGGLTANIAHEIRNPLSAISHATQLLLEEESLDATSRRLLCIINDNAQRLDKIVQNVMQLNQRDRVQQELIALADFVQSFREQYCQAEHIPLAGLRIEIGATGAAALFDRHQLHQVLWNLCRNGWRHSKQEAGSLTLRLEKAMRKGEVMLVISDDGSGVPPEILPRLFEPFFTTEKNGTGLGLHIARELCEANGASLRHEVSITGAQFRIYLKNQYV
ncbi:sensor protein ZraS [mine drainage metagenome]|uniref:Sensor protein ZraS n=1 Tax=mine drainage metagenome TaxID=410659 RepID=A0A1J5QRS4_9ZZZZ